MSERSCRSCTYWDRRPGQHAVEGRMYACKAPLPKLALPDSVTEHEGFRRALTERVYMERDQGKNCPCWARRERA